MTSPYLEMPYRSEAEARDAAGRRPTAVEALRATETVPTDRNWITRASALVVASAALACWALIIGAVWLAIGAAL